MQKLLHGGLPIATPPVDGSAKVSGPFAEWLRQVTLSAHTRWTVLCKHPNPRTQFLMENYYICIMRTSQKNTTSIDKDLMRARILKSMIASFRIENINIPEETAQEIYQRVRKKLKKVA